MLSKLKFTLSNPIEYKHNPEQKEQAFFISKGANNYKDVFLTILETIYTVLV